MTFCEIENLMLIRHYYFDKKNHKMDDFRSISKFKQQKKTIFEAKCVPKKKSLAFLFEESNALKRQFNHQKTASSDKSAMEG
jgi:hypothetical protein